ncbi:hypothetical protein SRABI64_06150 [Pseudomonas carnis]|nr:hypothetical protein SRABI64_06150 [Pseudomonas carnis]
MVSGDIAPLIVFITDYPTLRAGNHFFFIVTIVFIPGFATHSIYFFVHQIVFIIIIAFYFSIAIIYFVISFFLEIANRSTHKTISAFGMDYAALFIITPEIGHPVAVCSFHYAIVIIVLKTDSFTCLIVYFDHIAALIVIVTHQQIAGIFILIINCFNCRTCLIVLHFEHTTRIFYNAG